MEFLFTDTFTYWLSILQARLNHDEGGGAWCPRVSQFPRLDYLEVDLQQDHVISAVIIQGRFAKGIGKEFATHFMVKYWREGYREFEDYRDSNGEVLLEGNVNTFQAHEQKLDNILVIASKIRWKSSQNHCLQENYFRIIPYTLGPASNVCIRVELKGCKYLGKSGMYLLASYDYGNIIALQLY